MTFNFILIKKSLNREKHHYIIDRIFFLLLSNFKLGSNKQKSLVYTAKLKDKTKFDLQIKSVKVHKTPYVTLLVVGIG